MRSIVRLNWMLLCLVAAGISSAAELPPADLPIEQVIDQLVNERLTSEKVTPAPQADEFNLLRRLTLDLAGRIPTTAEAQAFAVVKSI